MREDGSTKRLVDSEPAVEQALRDEIQRRDDVIDGLRAALAARQEALTAIETSLGWKVIRRLRMARDRLAMSHPRAQAVVRRCMEPLQELLGREVAEPDADASRYSRWIEGHTPSKEALASMKTEADNCRHRALFSIVIADVSADRALLVRSLVSIRSQVWDGWEVVLPPIGDDLRQLVVATLGDDRRLRSGASGGAGDRQLAMGATGEFIAFLSPGDELAPEALHRLGVVVDRFPDADVVYSDEDDLDDAGRRSTPFFKPDWSPHLLLSMNYVGQLAVYRRTLLREAGAGGGDHPVEPYDLALRATERARRVVHVPEVLCHRRLRPEPRDGESEGGCRALEDALSRRGLRGTVEHSSGSAVFRVRRTIDGLPLVSIIIPSKDHPKLLRACIASIDSMSTWHNRELIIVDNGSTRRDAVGLLRELERRHTIIRDPRPFNWSALNNAAAVRARGEYLLFLNDDVEVLTADWIEALLEQSQQDGVGAVGGKLLYPDGTVQHAGIALGIGVAGHVFRRLPGDAPGYHGFALAVRDVSAVTGACLMAPRRVFDEAGGFDERLPVAFNDIDFCLRLRARGLAVVWTPHARLVHRESATRGLLHPPEAAAAMWERWGALLARDPFYSPHLTRAREDYAIRL